MLRLALQITSSKCKYCICRNLLPSTKIYIYVLERKSLDKYIGILMKLARDKGFERLVKLEKRKNSERIHQIKLRHQESKKMSVDLVNQLEEHAAWRYIPPMGKPFIKFCN